MEAEGAIIDPVPEENHHEIIDPAAENLEEVPVSDLIENQVEIKENSEKGLAQITQSEQKAIPKVHICLKGLTQESHAKSASNLEIIESLKIREAAKEAKISTNRLKYKANQIDPMRSAPFINPTSKKILEKKKKLTKLEQHEKDDSLFEYFPESYSVSKANESSKAKNENKKVKESYSEYITAEMVKNSMKLREEFNKSVQEQKRIQEPITSNQSSFRNPSGQNKSAKIEKGTSQPSNGHSKQKSMETGPFKTLRDFSYRIPPPTSKMPVPDSQNHFGQIPIVTEKYSQISPFLQAVKYQNGFNYEEIKAKGHEMVDYKLLAGS